MSIINPRLEGEVTIGSTIRIKGRKVLEAKYIALMNIYQLWLDIPVNHTSTLNAATVMSHDLLHRRFGHPSKEAIVRLPKAVKGVDSVDPPSDSACEGCAKGKMHRQPFPASHKRATEVLELIHTDVVGPLGNAIGGWRYFVTYLDDHASLGLTYCLKAKSEQSRSFDMFKALAENQTGKKIKRVRSDRGGEYMAEDFEDHLKLLGIEHEKTMPGSPQQNGRAERWNQTLMEKAMCMLHFAGLSHGFWQLALDTAVHIYNRQPMRRLKWRCPITAWDGTVPDVSYFRVFGCKAFVHVQKDKRHGKLDVKAVEMTFVGYESGSKGYKFWNPASRSIVVSRDVTFDENVFPARLTTGERRVTPHDNPFPVPDPSDESSNDDPEVVNIPLPFDFHPPVAEPDEIVQQQPDPAPAPQQPPQQEQLPIPPVPPPRPDHRRARHPPAVGEPPAPPPRRELPQRERRGQNPSRNKDNVYGDAPPAQVDARIDPDGTIREAQEVLQFLYASRYKAGLPNHHKDAMASSDAEQWKLAEKAEYESLLANKTWILVPRPKDRSVVSCRWVYDRKSDGRFKARLVAKGFTQVWGEDYHETFSPVARFESIRYLFAHAALEDWDIDAMDVKTAFLNGDLDEEIFMEQPEGWVVPGKEDYVCLLKKAIYGLKQASRQWNIKIHESLLKQGFQRTYSDAGVYVYRRQRGDSVTIIVLYVDDLLLMGNSRKHIDGVKRALSSQYQMTDLGPALRFLGLRMRRDRASRILDIDQEEYIQAIIVNHQMADCKPARTPLPAGAVLEASQSEASAQLRKRYQSLIGSLLYAMLGTRPDISFAVTRLSKYNANPSEAHWNYARYILRYLAGTSHYRLRYSGASNAGLIAYSDSDWAEDRDDRHSTTGFIFLMAGGAISWASRRQPTVSLSSTEAEYKAASDACRQMMWLRVFGEELGDDISSATPLCMDNQGAIFLAENPAIDRRTKHVEVRYHFIREYSANGNVDIYYVATKEQLADSLTKNVSFSILDYFCRGSGLVSSAS